MKAINSIPSYSPSGQIGYYHVRNGKLEMNASKSEKQMKRLDENSIVKQLKRKVEYFRGCLLGGAIGDALGWPVEFLSMNEIKQHYGEEGITDLKLNANEKASITDDTQMTLFTAEGLLRADTRHRTRGICHPPTMVYLSYLRWLYTQDFPKIDDCDFIYSGWLLKNKELYARRAPGNACLTALLSGEKGTVENPINDSKGCGGVMRVAPIGLFLSKDRAFELAIQCAALTHGHPSGYLSAGAFAYIIACIIDGFEIESSVILALKELGKYQGSEECIGALQKAIKLSQEDVNPLHAVQMIGQGWVGEEALAIAVYCAMKYNNDFKSALCLAVNHDGDSDSTGAITGNLLGAYLGLLKIPDDWVEKVELSSLLAQVADDLFTGYQETDGWWERYPGG